MSCVVASLSNGHTIHGPPDPPNRKLALYFFSPTTFCLMLCVCEILVFPCNLSAVVFMNQKIKDAMDLEAQNMDLWPFLTVWETFPPLKYSLILLKSGIGCSPVICAFCVSLYYGTHLLFLLQFNSFWRAGIMCTHWGSLVSKTQWALRNAEGIGIKTSVITICWYSECMGYW